DQHTDHAEDNEEPGWPAPTRRPRGRRVGAGCRIGGRRCVPTRSGRTGRRGIAAGTRRTGWWGIAAGAGRTWWRSIAAGLRATWWPQVLANLGPGSRAAPQRVQVLGAVIESLL